ncbi:Putative ribonuclease H protein At1g65750 [Linum perenne]
MGIRWQIGSGFVLHPLQINWVPTDIPTIPILRYSGSYSGPTSISGFILNGRWDRNLLREHFAETSVSKILQIPLSLTPFPDSTVWHLSGSGVYSTSSGYALAFRLKKPKKPRKVVVQIQGESLWLSTWELPVQPKLKFFLWRMLHRIIPTMDCLVDINMEVHPTCLVCHSAVETLEHLLFECPISLAFYHMARLTPPPFINTHFVIYWRSILQHQSNLAPIWVLAWWRVWKGRNHVVFNHAQYRIDSLFRQFASHLCELPLFCLPSLPSHPPSSLAPVSRQPRWIPPHPQRLKVNVDGAVQAPLGGSTGWVLRAPTGMVLHAVGTPYPGITDPFILELLACRDAVSWCVSSGLFQVDFEGDAEMVSKAVRDQESTRAQGGIIVQEVSRLLASSPSFKLLSVRRSANRAAHSVARLALRYLPGVLPVVLTPWVDCS